MLAGLGMGSEDDQISHLASGQAFSSAFVASANAQGSIPDAVT